MSVIRLEKLLRSGAGGALEDIVQTAQAMDQLTSWLKQGLEADLAANLLAASLRKDGELVVVAQSSAWAAKFRFEAEEMMAILRRHGEAVEKCRVTVTRT